MGRLIDGTIARARDADARSRACVRGSAPCDVDVVVARDVVVGVRDVETVWTTVDVGIIDIVVVAPIDVAPIVVDRRAPGTGGARTNDRARRER